MVENHQKFSFEDKFHKPAYDEISAVTRIADLDLVVVAVPTESHMDTVKKIVSKLSPKLILIEKPLSFLFDEVMDLKVDYDYNKE